MKISRIDANRRRGGSFLRERSGRGRTIMRVNPRPRRRLVTRKSDPVEEHDERRRFGSNDDGCRLGQLGLSSLSRPWSGLCELLACNVIVFDAVILQCRAYTHASRGGAYLAHPRRSVVITAAPCFSIPSCPFLPCLPACLPFGA